MRASAHARAFAQFVYFSELVFHFSKQVGTPPVFEETGARSAQFFQNIDDIGPLIIESGSSILCFCFMWGSCSQAPNQYTEPKCGGWEP